MNETVMSYPENPSFAQTNMPPLKNHPLGEPGAPQPWSARLQLQRGAAPRSAGSPPEGDNRETRPYSARGAARRAHTPTIAGVNCALLMQGEILAPGIYRYSSSSSQPVAQARLHARIFAASAGRARPPGPSC